MSAQTPRILVLLATHNGKQHLPEQLDSLLAQRGVAVSVLASDDNSTDGTLALLREYARRDARVRLLSPGSFGSAAANFFRLIRDADTSGFAAVAFCDQDDLWVADKLEQQLALLSLPQGLDGCGAYGAVSSNVTAFTEAGMRQLILKSQPQRALDYAFESAGPGSTFLLRQDAFTLVQRELRNPESATAHAAAHAVAHDWLTYALVRAAGLRWHIDDRSTVHYRQHEANVLGANEGWQQHLRRLRAIASGEFRNDVSAVTAAALSVAADAQRQQLAQLAARLNRATVCDRFQLIRQTRKFRRRRRDRLTLAATIALGVF